MEYASIQCVFLAQIDSVGPSVTAEMEICMKVSLDSLVYRLFWGRPLAWIAVTAVHKTSLQLALSHHFPFQTLHAKKRLLHFTTFFFLRRKTLGCVLPLLSVYFPF
jgi:hypothetical protein